MLGFRLNEEQEAFRLAVRSFAEKSLAPRVDELEETETFPRDLFRELGRLGYLGVGYPEEYGGSGGDMVLRCLLIEEIARVNCGFAAALLAHVGLGCIPIFRFGTRSRSGATSCPPSAARSSARSASPSPTRAPTRPPSAPAPSGAATSTSSTGPRCSSPTATSPTTAWWPPTPTPPSAAAASPCSSSTPGRPASRCRAS